MNVYVCIKQVPDTEAKIVLKDDKTIDETGIKWIMSPYDEYAVEEAIQFKEKQGDCQVIIVSLGPERAQETIRTALAMGGDRALHIVHDDYPDSTNIAKALANVIKNDGDYQLVFTGKQATDDDAYQVHLRLAHYLAVSATTNAIAFEYNDGAVNVSREIGGGTLEKLELSTPALVAVTKGINTPRYPTLPNIMKAKRKEIKKLTLADAGIEDVSANEVISKLQLPAEKSGGRVLSGEHGETVAELVTLLHEEAQVI